MSDFIGPQLPEGWVEPYDPNKDYSELYDGQEGHQTASFTEEDLKITGDEVFTIVKDSLVEGYNTITDVADTVSTGVTKTYRDIYNLVLLGIIVGGSIFIYRQIFYDEHGYKRDASIF